MSAISSNILDELMKLESNAVYSANRIDTYIEFLNYPAILLSKSASQAFANNFVALNITLVAFIVTALISAG